MKPTYVLRLEKEPPHRLRVFEEERLTYGTSLGSVESIEQVIAAIDSVFDDHPCSNLYVRLYPADEATSDEETGADQGWSAWSFDEGRFLDFYHSCGDLCFMLGDQEQAAYFYEQPLMSGSDRALETKLLWLRGVEPEAPNDDDDDSDYRDTVARILIHRGGFRLNQTFFSGAALDFKRAIEIWPECIADVRVAAATWRDAGFTEQASVLEQVIRAASQ